MYDADNEPQGIPPESGLGTVLPVDSAGPAEATPEAITSESRELEGVSAGATAAQPPAAVESAEPPAGSPQAEVAGQAPDLGEIEARLLDLAERHRKLYDLVEERFRVDAARDAMIDKLHGELQEHRNDLLRRILLPVLRDLIRLREQLLKFVAARRGYDVERRNWDNLLDNVLSFGDDLMDLLERYGLTAFREEEPRFNPRSQRAVRVVATEDAALDRTIAEHLHPGFRWGDQFIAHEQVVIHKLASGGGEAGGGAGQEG